MSVRLPLVLSLALSVAASCGPRTPPVAPGTAAGAATMATCLAGDPAIARVLADLGPDKRDVALRALQARAASDAPEAARLAAAGRSPEAIVAALGAGSAAAGAEAADADDGSDRRDPPPPPAEYHPIAVPAWAPIRGPREAKVTMVVFSDFQCPFCARLVPTVEALQKKYGDDLRVVWRNLPLPFHPRARPAAEAAMAAADQGKFWAMHDRIFVGQRALDDESLRRYASEAGLDLTRYQADLDAHKHAGHIDADLGDGRAASVTGTPTIFINGRKIAGAYPTGTFVAVVDEELARATRVLASGVALSGLYARLLADNPAPPPPEADDEPEEAAAPVALRIPADAPSRGPTNAAVTIVEFSDFQCPFCGRAQPTLEALEKKYEGRLRLVFLHLPLPFHQHARLAAEAAMAAHAQGKFWAMHDKLFANQRALERADLDRYADELHLERAAFARALDEHSYGDRVQQDSDEARRVGASGTPTFYLNGVPLHGAQPAERFEAVIDRLLATRKAPAARPAARPHHKGKGSR